MIDVSKVRLEKLNREIETAKRIQEKGIHPLKVLDELISEMSILMETGILERSPGLIKQEVLNEMRKLVALNDKYSKKHLHD
jgi:hypothetical protein